jgi:hypothetical protein
MHMLTPTHLHQPWRWLLRRNFGHWLACISSSPPSCSHDTWQQGKQAAKQELVDSIIDQLVNHWVWGVLSGA